MGKQLQDPEGEKMNNTVDRCDLCGGELKPDKTTLEIWRGEELLVIKDVPADVCQQCNEAYISANVSERLDYFLSEYHRHRPERYLAVPQYSAVQAMEG
ncbi:type II toxin-antitoxin system MqsA family antitoxin [Candidatus Poribacteria bacterium]|nr:type II toxin-antitoxin system MqsA family antitoxin [Candidatus Poribacteria bacterium]